MAAARYVVCSLGVWSVLWNVVEERERVAWWPTSKAGGEAQGQPWSPRPASSQRECRRARSFGRMHHSPQPSPHRRPPSPFALARPAAHDIRQGLAGGLRGRRRGGRRRRGARRRVSSVGVWARQRPGRAPGHAPFGGRVWAQVGLSLRVGGEWAMSGVATRGVGGVAGARTGGGGVQRLAALGAARTASRALFCCCCSAQTQLVAPSGAWHGSNAARNECRGDLSSRPGWKRQGATVEGPAHSPQLCRTESGGHGVGRTRTPLYPFGPHLLSLSLSPAPPSTRADVPPLAPGAPGSRASGGLRRALWGRGAQLLPKKR